MLQVRFLDPAECGLQLTAHEAQLGKALSDLRTRNSMMSDTIALDGGGPQSALCKVSRGAPAKKALARSSNVGLRFLD